MELLCSSFTVKAEIIAEECFFFIQSELVSQTGIVLETNIDGLLSSVAIHFWENPQGFKNGFYGLKEGEHKGTGNPSIYLKML